MRYFAYGANMNPGTFWYRCPSSQFLGVHEVKGYKFFIDSYGVASIKKDEESSVFGVLWNIDEEGERTLDVFEGVAQGHYTKESIEVDGLNALVYISSDTRKGSGRSSYMKDIIHSAIQHDFPQYYIDYLEDLFNT